MKSLLSAACHQCNIFSNNFTYSPSTSSPSSSPSMTITIYHQHHYHHFYHHGLCHHSFHPAMNHPLFRAMCPLFVSLCDSIQTYSVIVPAEAVWQPDQLHFDDARTCLAWQLQLCNDYFDILKGLCHYHSVDMYCQDFCTVCLLRTFPSHYSIGKQHVIPAVQHLYVVFSCFLIFVMISLIGNTIVRVLLYSVDRKPLQFPLIVH